MEFLKKIFLINKKRYNDEISYEEAKKIILSNKNVFLIDVRSPQEYKENHLPNSYNITVYEIEKTIEKQIPEKNSIIILYCATGHRSRKALEKLKKIGYENLYNLKDGIEGISL